MPPIVRQHKMEGICCVGVRALQECELNERYKYPPTPLGLLQQWYVGSIQKDCSLLEGGRRMNEEMNEHESMISEEDFSELWNMWFGLADSPTITEKLRQINHEYNLGLVEE